MLYSALYGNKILLSRRVTKSFFVTMLCGPQASDYFVHDQKSQIAFVLRPEHRLYPHRTLTNRYRFIA
jgi:hypothetical protein